MSTRQKIKLLLNVALITTAMLFGNSLHAGINCKDADGNPVVLTLTGPSVTIKGVNVDYNSIEAAEWSGTNVTGVGGWVIGTDNTVEFTNEGAASITVKIPDGTGDCEKTINITVHNEIELDQPTTTASVIKQQRIFNASNYSSQPMDAQFSTDQTYKGTVNVGASLTGSATLAKVGAALGVTLTIKSAQNFEENFEAGVKLGVVPPHTTLSIWRGVNQNVTKTTYTKWTVSGVSSTGELEQVSSSGIAFGQTNTNEAPKDW